MQVFKLCMNIIRKNLPIMLIYVVIFLFVSLIISSSATDDTQQKEASFTPQKINIAFISEENSILIDGFRAELEKIANFIPVDDERQALQDALFFRSVSYILRVPAGFTEKFMRGENIQLEKTIVPDSTSNIYIDLCIDKYFNTARLYIKHMEGVTQETLVRNLESDLSLSTAVEIKAKTGTKVNQSYANYFFNYFSYSLLSVIILGMSTLMLVFNNRDLKMRNQCSPLSATSINLQFVLSNLLFTFVTWLVMVLLCLIVNYKNSLSTNTVFFLLSSFVFAFCCSSISFLIGNLIKSEGAISAVTNIVALGSCFISGVFVPQELIGKNVLKIASFTPTYWYVKANNTIANLNQFDFAHRKTVFSDLLIVAGFGLAFFSVALVIAKKKRA